MRRIAGPAVIAFALLGLTGPALASVGGGVDSFVVSGKVVTVTVRGTAIDPSTLRVTVAGQPVATTPTLQHHEGRTAPRIMLVVDTSGSMAGASIVAAQRAAADFAKRVAPTAKVGLVSFSDQPRIVTAPSTDRQAVLTGLAALRAGGNTSLYDAIAVAMVSLGSAGERQLVVLSDGSDTTSTIGLAALQARLTASGIALDAVALTTAEATSAGLRQLAAAVNGRVVPASSALALSEAFRQIQVAAADVMTLRIPLPANRAGRPVEVTVSVRSGDGLLTRSGSVSVPGIRAAVATVHSTASRISLWLGLAAFGAGLLALLVVLAGQLLRSDGGDRRRTRNLVRGYGLAEQQVGSDALESHFGDGAVAKTAVEWAGRVSNVERTSRRALALDRAGMRFTADEWLLVQVGAALLGAAVLGTLFRNGWLAALGVVVGTLIPMAIVRFKGKRRMTAFREELADSLRLVSSSLLSGYAFAQALDGLVSEGMQPMAGEISRALAEARLGVGIEDALDKVAERMDSKDMHWAVMAVRVQREVGGNLAEVLNTIAATVRERSYLRRQVSTLSAEGRLSAYVLIGMPILVALFTFTTRRSYMRALWTTAPGAVMSIGAVVMLLFGALWMRKLIDVEV